MWGLERTNDFLRKVVGKYSDSPKRLLDSRILRGDVIPTILDNFPFPARTSEIVEGCGVKLPRIVLPIGLRQKMIGITKNWSVGDSRGTVITVGKRESGSSHPHLFEVKKTYAGTRLLFVDPEDTVGARNLFKPSVMILMAALIRDYPEYDYPIDFHYFRYSDRGLHPKQKHLPFQYKLAEELVEFDGLTSSVRISEQDTHLLLNLFPDGTSFLCSRYISRGKIDRFLFTGRGPLALEERVKAIRDNLSIFRDVLDSSNDRQSRVYQSVVEKSKGL